MIKEEIKYKLENTEMTLQQIADNLKCGYKLVYNVWRKYPLDWRRNRKVNNYRKSKTGYKNPMKDKTGVEHHNYKGIVGDNKGYLMMLKPSWYTGRKGSKHVFVHTVVICEHNGLTELPKNMSVHHCDKNPHNNDISNLIGLPMNWHSKLHVYLRSLGGATTISKESTAKWLEMQGVDNILL